MLYLIIVAIVLILFVLGVLFVLGFWGTVVVGAIKDRKKDHNDKWSSFREHEMKMAEKAVNRLKKQGKL